MTLEDLAATARRDRARATMAAVALAVLLAAALAWATVHFLQPAPPRRIVLASGPAFGLYHRFATQYKAYLAREGVTLVERMTTGAAENATLLADPRSGVDVAFMQGGVVPAEPNDLVMIASLYYEPLWLFHRGPSPLDSLNGLAGMRIGVGEPGSGTRALAMQLLAASAVVTADGRPLAGTTIVDIGGAQALQALRDRSIDAVVFVGGAQTPVIREALHDPALSLTSFARADAYPRRFPFITQVLLPQGAIDFAADIPRRDVKLIASEAMLASRRSLQPALAGLLLDAARDIHRKQGLLEAAGEFPNVTPVDLPVSPAAERHMRFGPSFMYRYLPFWLASMVEQAIVVVVPLFVTLVPLLRFVPQLMRWRVRRRIFRWYGELALLEQAIRAGAEVPPYEAWNRALARIERAVADIRTPTSYASEVYTLRGHVALVRQALDAHTTGR
jgi:TRAP-type uncharacterized transport system substrate-binding protein